MNLRNAKYLINEGIKSFWINGLMSLASSIIVTASLVIFGIYILFTMNINHIGQQLMDQYEIQVFMYDISDERTEEVRAEIAEIPHVNGEINYVSKVAALEAYRENLGKNARILNGLGEDNPLPASFLVTLDDLLHSQEVVDEISKISDVEEVKNNKDVMDQLLKITSLVRSFSLWLMVLLSMVSVFIISNAIKITVYARRREINIMKYIGATDRFISWPFIIEGMIIGIIGAMISLLLVSQAYLYAVPQITQFLGGVIKLYAVREILWQLLAWFVGVGVVLGAVGSAVSLRKHLQV